VPDRSKRIVGYLTPREKAEFAELSDKLGKTQSDLVRDAVLEYLDQDRSARIEEKVDRILTELGDAPTEVSTGAAYTHKQSGGASETVQKVREIAERLTSNHGEVVKDVDVKRGIEDIAGGDERTISKYKQMLRERSLLFEHPSSDAVVWTPEQSVWVDWVEQYGDNVPDADVPAILSEHGLTVDEYENALGIQS